MSSCWLPLFYNKIDEKINQLNLRESRGIFVKFGENKMTYREQIDEIYDLLEFLDSTEFVIEDTAHYIEAAFRTIINIQEEIIKKLQLAAK